MQTFHWRGESFNNLHQTSKQRALITWCLGLPVSHQQNVGAEKVYYCWDEHACLWQDITAWNNFQRRLIIKAQVTSPTGAESLYFVRTGIKGMQQDSINCTDLSARLEGLERKTEAKLIPWMNEHDWFGQTLSWRGWLPPPGQSFGLLNCNYRVPAKWTLRCQKPPAQSPGVKTAFQPSLLLTGKWSFAKTHVSRASTQTQTNVSHFKYLIIKIALF